MTQTPARPAWLDWPDIQALVQAFAAHPQALRFVGGAVRDALLGRAVKDVDAATSLPPQEVMALLEKAGIRAVPTGIAHGTVTAVLAEKQVEITTLRKDMACDGRHADVAFTDSWEDDAARRDFTMNALYVSPQGEWFDYFGGMQDARDGKVRFIGEAAQRIREDYLRILRYFRFFAWYGGQGRPDWAALEACRDAAEHLSALSGERVQKELLLLLEAPTASEVLETMREYKVLTPALGVEVKDVSALESWHVLHGKALSQHGVAPPAYMQLALLARATGKKPVEAAKIISERLKLPRAMAGRIEAVLLLYPFMKAGDNQARTKELIRKFSKPLFDALALVKACSEPKAEAAFMAMLGLSRRWEVPEFPLTGQDLLDLGMAPGKAVGERLKELEAYWEAQHYAPGRKELLERAAAP